MTLPYAIMIFVTLQRISELVIARSNTKALLARGAVEYGRSHYPVMVAMHASWLAVLWASVGGAPVNLPLLAVFAVLQAHGRIAEGFRRPPKESAASLYSTSTSQPALLRPKSAGTR